MKLLILSALGFIISLCNVDAQKISEDVLIAFDKNEKVECLIVFKDQADVSECKSLKGKIEKGNCVFEKLQTNKLSQNALTRELENRAIQYQSFLIVNIISAKLDIEEAQLFASRKEVKKIINNPWTNLEEPSPSQDVTSRGAGEPEWGIKMIQADSVWSLGYEGEEVVVAGQDTGYDWDNDLIVSKYRGVNTTDTIHDYNWHDAIHDINPLNNDTIIEEFTNPCGLNSIIPCDDHGHGSHTMGTMVGSGDNDLIGVAPKAKWIGCRNMDRGNGKPSTYLECFEWFLAPTEINGENPDPSLAPHVINNSWSCPEEEGCFKDHWMLFDIAIENLKTAGIVVVVSAGNDGAKGCGSIAKAPGMLEQSFSIGATGTNDTIAAFSSRGPVIIDSSFRIKPDISAPGVAVRSIHLNGNFRTWNGTSMAGPHVAGTVALIINANPSLAGEVETIENILRISAVDKLDTMQCETFSGQVDPNHIYGEGRLNALRAVELALGILSTEEADYTKSFKFYPNPAHSYLTVENHSNHKLDWKIYNQLGQLVESINFNPQEIQSISLENYGTGLYFIQWKNETYIGIERLVISK